MIHKFVIEGRLPGMNDIIGVASRNRYASGTLKKKSTELCATYALQIKPIKNPIKITCEWIEPNEKRDLDNISAGIKYILDGLVMSGRLQNDTRRWVRGITHLFPPADKANPRIIISLEELEA